MSESKIEWTDRTWNPIVGCSRVSPGCQHCYAERMAKRLQAMGTRGYEGVVNERGQWTGKLNFVESVLAEPLRRKKPTMYFVNSMSDLFHENVPNEWIAAIFAVMHACPQHQFQCLTKRPDRMLKWFEWVSSQYTPMDRARILECSVLRLHAKFGLETQKPFNLFSAWNALGYDWPLKNVWLGVSVENQEQADKRIPLLLQTPAAVRWLSCEPLLGEIDLSAWIHWSHSKDEDGIKDSSAETLIDWAIVGGESGPDARPMHPKWARSLRDQCVSAGIPFFFKQWGEYVPGVKMDSDGWEWALQNGDRGKFKGKSGHRWDDNLASVLVGKKAAGRMLDGREWNEFPNQVAAVPS